MFLLEQRWWPDQPNETALNIATPNVVLKLSVLLRPGWREQHHLIRLAMASLVTLRDWFMDCFDEQLHRESRSIIQDALLVFQTAVDLFDLYDATQEPPAPTRPADEPPPTSTPTAGSWDIELFVWSYVHRILDDVGIIWMRSFSDLWCMWHLIGHARCMIRFAPHVKRRASNSRQRLSRWYHVCSVFLFYCDVFGFRVWSWLYLNAPMIYMFDIYNDV